MEIKIFREGSWQEMLNGTSNFYFMLKKILTATVLLFSLTSVYAQNNIQYKREVKKFIQFVRDSEFAEIDTLICRNYLCNKGLFSSMPLYGTGRNGLSEDEKSILLDNARNDTNRFYIPNRMIKRSILVPDIATSKKVWILSKPIFLRSYLLCAFSYLYDDEVKVFLYKKENGKWSKLFLIGRVANY